VVVDVLRHAVLPAITLGLLTAGVFPPPGAHNVIATLGTGYVEAARSRGVTERRLLRAHAWRPRAGAIITVIGLQIAMLLGGAVLTETTFEWKGLGFQLVHYLLGGVLPVWESKKCRWNDSSPGCQRGIATRVRLPPHHAARLLRLASSRSKSPSPSRRAA